MMSLRLACAFECATCGLLLTLDTRDAALVDLLLMGAVRYAVCPTCLQEVPREDQTRRYRMLWTIGWKKKRARRGEDPILARRTRDRSGCG